MRPYTDAVIAVPCWLVSSSQPILPAHDGWCHNWDCFGVQHNIRSPGAQLWGVYSWRQPGRGWHDINSGSQGFHDSKLWLFFSLLLTGAGCWLLLVSAQLQFYLRRRRNLSGVIFVFSQTWGSSIKWCAGGFSYLLVQAGHLLQPNINLTSAATKWLKSRYNNKWKLHTLVGHQIDKLIDK